jgi:gluconate 5-dehydrogenase
LSQSESLFELREKTALITGSNGGLGFHIAEGMGKTGCRIILNGRNEEKLNNAVSKLQEKGIDASGFAFDVTKPGQINKSVERIEEEVGAIDILINNAGIHKRMPMEEMSDQAWQDVIEANLSSVFYVTRAVVKGMIKRNAGKIINICSLMSEVHRPTLSNYSAAKGGLKMLTRAMAVEFAKHNIQANGIGPGYFETALTKHLVEDVQFNSWICSRTPAGRWGKPEELIGAAIFLSTKASSFINGQIIYVDGGILAGL